MNIILVSPPIQDMYFTPGRSSALGMHTVAALLDKTGEKVSALNCPQLKPEGTAIPPLQGTGYLQKFIMPGERGKLSFFTGYRHFGLSFTECAEKIHTLKPDLVLVSSFAFAYADAALALIEAIRAHGCTVPVGIGGAGPSAFPEYYLKHKGIDFVVTGEAETILSLIISRIKSGSTDFSGISNTYFKKDGEISVPSGFTYPESEDLELVWSVTGETANTMYISTSLSRGCPKRCRFCSNFITHNRRFRTVSVDKIKEKLYTFPKHKRIILNFEDDNLTFLPEYFFKVLTLFTSAVPDIHFMAENGIDYSFLTPESIKKLVHSGFIQFNLSLGTLSEKSAASENRPLSLIKYETILREIEKYSVPVITYFICGLQGDTPESVVETLLYLAELPTLAGISPFYPVPGLYGFTDRNLFKEQPPSACRGAAFYPWNGTLTTGEMVTAFRLARFVNLTKQERHTPLEKELLQRITTTGKLHTIVRKNKRNILAEVPFMDGKMVSLFFKNRIDGLKGF